MPRVGNVAGWSSDEERFTRAFKLSDILESFVGTAIREECKAKARHIPHIGSSDSDIQNLSLLDPHVITSDKLTRDNWDHLARILQI